MILIGTLLASWCGGGGITGSASVVYLYGPVVGTLHFAGAPIGMLLLYFISSKVRSSTKITVPEVFAARYGDGASIIAVICIMLAYVGLCATQIKAAGNIISLITGMDANLANRAVSGRHPAPDCFRRDDFRGLYGCCQRADDGRRLPPCHPHADRQGRRMV